MYLYQLYKHVPGLSPERASLALHRATLFKKTTTNKQKQKTVQCVKRAGAVLICYSSSLEVALAWKKEVKKCLKNVPKHYSLMMGWVWFRVWSKYRSIFFFLGTTL